MIRAATIGLFLLSGCAALSPVHVAESLGRSGWYQVDPIALPRPYEDRFERVPLGVLSPTCEQLRASQRYDGPALVLVPGVHGDGPEWGQIIPRFSTLMPASVYMFRWVPYDQRDALASRLALGVHRLSACLPKEQQIVVLAHSAGGIIASLAASLIAVPPAQREERPRVVVLTVASALAGAHLYRPNSDGTAEPRFLLDLGAAISSYPAAAEGVRVYHLRTRYPADPVMRPTPWGGLPNDPAVGVPGARQVDLPVRLGHDQALVYVAQRLIDGTWDSWTRVPASDLTVY